MRVKMILPYWILPTSDFVPQANAQYSGNLSPVLVGHDTGTTTTLVINYQWRRIVSGLLAQLLDRGYWIGDETDIDDTIQYLHLLLDDLYD